jgi:FtsZ-interacting cell division protein ZipA
MDAIILVVSFVAAFLSLVLCTYWFSRKASWAAIMPKKSRKSLSKRVKLKDKFKIARKVKEHHKKVRKEAKNSEKRKPNILKDPGVPTNYPYREQVMKELQFEHQRILAQRAEKKEAAKRRRAEVCPDTC